MGQDYYPFGSAPGREWPRVFISQETDMTHQGSPKGSGSPFSKTKACPAARRWQAWLGASLVIFCLAVLSSQTTATSPKVARVARYTNDDAVEKGKVNWLRDFDAAQKASAANGKPLLVLFQEIPG